MMNKKSKSSPSDAEDDRRRVSVGFPQSNQEVNVFYLLMEAASQSQAGAKATSNSTFIRTFLMRGWWHFMTQTPQLERDRQLMELGIKKEDRLLLERYISNALTYENFVQELKHPAAIDAPATLPVTETQENIAAKQPHIIVPTLAAVHPLPPSTNLTASEPDSVIPDSARGKPTNITTGLG